MNELKPCPFCAESSVHIEKHVAYTPTGYLYLVRCSNIPFCGIRQTGFFTEEEAVEAWNRRADNE